MKKLIALLLALACLFSLGACTAQGQATDYAGGPSDTGKDTDNDEWIDHMREDDAELNADLAPYRLAGAVYPEMPPYPKEEDFLGADGEYDWDAYDRAWSAWQEASFRQRSQADVYAGALDGFLTDTIRQTLAGAGEGNRIYSPLNVYMALAMLAEVTDGESRAQLLDLLGADSLETLRETAAALWTVHYSDDGWETSILASSLWLRDDDLADYDQATLDGLARYYYASAFRGEMGSEEYNNALQTWLNEQTGGLLEEQAKGVELDPLTVLALATTVYYKGAWQDEFREGATREDIFHAPTGDVTVDFMHQSFRTDYYTGDRFAAVRKTLGSGSMLFLLPDEGVDPEALLSDPQAMDMLLHGSPDLDVNHLTVNLALPKFDVSSDLELTEMLQALGVVDVFDGGLSDFSPLAENADALGLAVSQVRHAARVKVDEEGCEAAAYTVIMVNATSAMPDPEEVDFVLDRPFLFAITGSDGLPTFVGIVNNP